MTADKPLSSPVMSPLAAISLKLVGIVTILSALLDFLTLLLPPDFDNKQWLLNLTTSFVDRGIVPFVGIALLLTGFWVDRTSGKSNRAGTLLLDLRFWSCIVACILGVVFFIMAFLHVNNVRINARDALAQVEQQANQASTQLEQRIEGAVNQQQSQLQALFQDENLLQQAVSSGQLSEDFLQFRDDPAALDQFLSQRATEEQQRIATEIGTRREDARQQVRVGAIKSAARISLSSLLLTIGYTVVGWIGLRRLLSASRA